MRIGTNPVKNDLHIKVENYHRVIIPVYIPNFEGYFANSFEVFKLCLESILKTVHSKTRITIYNNNSNDVVKKYIDEKYQESELIDQVFHSKENVGKINALLAGAKGNIEPLITITDADVLYINGWQEAIEECFLGFPEAGMVSPTPLSSGLLYNTSSNWYYGFFNGKLAFNKVQNPEAMHKFDKSLGNASLKFSEIHLQKYLVIKNKKNNCEAVFGCGHFACTLKREVFDKGSNSPAFQKIEGGVEKRFIDTPSDDLGYLRLATKENYAFHMGNSTEPWMFETFNKIVKNTNAGIDFKEIEYDAISPLGFKIGNFILRLVSKPIFRKKVFNFLGLNYNGKY